MPSPVKSKVSCSVFGCSNSYRKCPPGTCFYTYPNECKYPQRRRLWLNAVKRINHDGTDWNPSKFQKICSNHFIGNTKSEDAASPSYAPSLHLGTKHIVSPSKDALKKEARYKRASKRKGEQLPTSKDYKVGTNNYKNTGTQTTDFLLLDEDCTTQFSCTFINETTAETQACFPSRHNSSTQTDSCFKTNSKSGPDIPYHSSFDGYRSLSENTLSELTGVRLVVFNLLLTLLPLKNFNFSLSPENRLLLFLMKMKLGISFSALACIFGVHRTTAAANFKALLNLLYLITKDWILWPQRQTVQETMPLIFKSKYATCRAIIDCTEIFCERPATVRQRVLMYSNYKGTFTTKFLIAITPSGFISFLSKGYGGRSTDSFITVNSGFLDLVEPGDLIMSDKGFPEIKSSIEGKPGCTLVMPPFGSVEKSQFSAEELKQTYSIASVRIHVERAIQRVKIYNVIQKATNEILPYLDKIVHLCAVLANLQSPIIKQ